MCFSQAALFGFGLAVRKVHHIKRPALLFMLENGDYVGSRQFQLYSGFFINCSFMQMSNQ